MVRRTLSILVIAAAVAALLFGLARGTFAWANARSFMITGDLVQRVDTSERVVALTFDDGPTTTGLAEIRQALKSEGVIATFFLVGEDVATHPAAARALAADGHQLANHSFTHQRMWFHRPSWYAEELDRTNARLRAIGHQGPIQFRPPYGKKLIGLPLALSQRDMTAVMWDVDPLDVGATTPKRIETYVAQRVRPGSIVLLHPWHSADVRAAIQPTIRRLKAAGYRFVSVDELLTQR